MLLLLVREALEAVSQGTILLQTYYSPPTSIAPTNLKITHAKLNEMPPLIRLQPQISPTLFPAEAYTFADIVFSSAKLSLTPVAEGSAARKSDRDRKSLPTPAAETRCPKRPGKSWPTDRAWPSPIILTQTSATPSVVWLLIHEDCFSHRVTRACAGSRHPEYCTCLLLGFRPLTRYGMYVKPSYTHQVAELEMISYGCARRSQLSACIARTDVPEPQNASTTAGDCAAPFHVLHAYEARSTFRCAWLAGCVLLAFVAF